MISCRGLRCDLKLPQLYNLATSLVEASAHLDFSRSETTMRIVNPFSHGDSTRSDRHDADYAIVVEAARICLRVAAWALTLFWVALWLLYPTTPGSYFKQDLATHVVSSFFGDSGIILSRRAHNLL